MSVLPVGIAASGDEGYTLDNSLRFRKSSPGYLSRTFTSVGNRTTWTWSAWVKRSLFPDTSALWSSSTTSDMLYIAYNGNLTFYPGTSGKYVRSSALLRDPSAWYHLMLVWDTTNATASERVLLYINGVKQTAANGGEWPNGYPALNETTGFNNNAAHGIGIGIWNLASKFDGYMTEINFIDGQALTADDFGEFDGTTGVWKPKEYTGTYGTNGFYLPTTATTQAEGFNTVLYTGTGASQSISDVGFSPDLVWIKRRDSAANHCLTDTVRGATNTLFSDGTFAESTGLDGVTSFDSDGFTVGTNASHNSSGNTFVAWCWDAGSGSPVTNTAGSINSTVKANPEKGFSIVSWEYDGSGNPISLGHGLSQAPEMMIQKQRDAATDWHVWHKNLTSIDYDLYLQSTSGEVTNSDWGNTDPTSSVFYSATTGVAGRRMIGYMFHSVAGYSKFGSYTGTGSSGNSVTGLGFQPAFVMIKETSSTGNWVMLDNTRGPDNQMQGHYLWANLTSAEAGASAPLTFDSDGFTINSSDSDTNTSSQTYIYMAFADTRDAQFNFDASGNKNNWTPNNINSNASSESSYDIMTDVPTLTDENTANYCTLTPFSFRTSHGAPMTLSEGNLKAVPIASTAASVVGSMSPSSGKFYWEITFPVVASASTGYGLCTTENVQSASTGASGIYYTRGSGGTIVSGGSTVASSVGVPAAGDIMSIAYDADANEATFRLKNVVLGTGAYSVPTTSNLLPFIYMASTSNAAYANFGQRPFAYTPPTGFLPLNTYNLPDSTIEDGSEHFNTVLYTGNGTTGHAITGVGFEPSFTWIKSRSGANNHILTDAVRGVTKTLISDSTSAELTVAQALTSFDSDGFTVGYDGSAIVNQNTNAYVSWNWKANGSGVSNTDGTIPSTVSANTTAGFSIVSYTGTGSAGTVGHGLNSAPDMVIIKNRTDGGANDQWYTWHSGLSGNNYFVELDTTNTQNTQSTLWDGPFTSSVFDVKTNNGVNGSGDDIIAYCFAGVEGFSAFGKYTGNGSTDGPFIYTGFRPAFVIYKNTTASGTSWMMYDSSRNLYNSVDAALYAESTSAETSYYDLDFLSNGFKIRTTTTNLNGSGATYIYAAFAENPFKNSLAR